MGCERWIYSPGATGRRGRRPVAECRVRALRVVFHAPLLDHYLCLLQRVENFPVQAFIPQFSVEALAVAVLPRTSRLDVQRPGTHLAQPFPQFLRHELRTIVRTNVFRYSVEQHHVRKGFDHFIPPKPSGHTDRQALPGVFVDQRQHPQHSAVVRHRTHEVVTPHMLGPLWSQPHARSIVQPQPPTGPLFLRYFQPLTTPDALHPILAYLPASTLQQRRNSPVSVAPVFTGQCHDRFRQRIFVDPRDRGIALCPSPLPQQPAGMSLAHFVFFARMLHRTTPLLRAQKFPEATSFRIRFSRDSSATKRFSFAFSRSNSFSRFA